jgi:hypothetical protein
MSLNQGEKSEPKRRVFTSGAFLASTAVAVVLGIVLIVLGRTGYTRVDYFIPPPTITPSSTPSSTVIPTKTPSPSVTPTKSSTPTSTPTT